MNRKKMWQQGTLLWGKCKFSQEEIRVCIATFCAGFIFCIYFLIHEIGYADMNLASEYYFAGGWELSCGRWLWVLLSPIRWGVSSVAVNTVLSLLWLSFSVVFLIRLLAIKSKLGRYLTGLLLAVAPFFYDILSSVHCSSEYLFGFFLSVLSVYILYTCKSSIIGVIVGGLSFACSLGIYQSYIGVTCGLCLLTPLVLLLKEREKALSVFKRMLWSVAMGVVGLILYYLILKVMLNIYNIEMASYSGLDEIGGLHTILQIPTLLGDTLKSFYQYFFGDGIINNSAYKRGRLSALLFLMDAAVVTTLVYQVTRVLRTVRERASVIALTVICIFALPFALGVIEMIVPERDIGQFMCAPYILVLISSLSLAEFTDFNVWKRVICGGTAVILTLTFWSYLVMENASYMAANMRQEQYKMIAEGAISKIWESGTYQSGTKVMFAGAPRSEVFDNSSGIFQLAGGQTYMYGLVWNNAAAPRCWWAFIRYHLGIDLALPSDDECVAVAATEMYKEMPLYPAGGSIQRINDIMVVKLSNDAFP